MDEYIERGMAIAKLTALEITEPCATLMDAKRLLADMPAADVVPMVRCGECIHRDPEDEKCDCGCWHIPFTVKDDDFCSYGERKNNANEPAGT